MVAKAYATLAAAEAICGNLSRAKKAISSAEHCFECLESNTFNKINEETTVKVKREVKTEDLEVKIKREEEEGSEDEESSDGELPVEVKTEGENNSEEEMDDDGTNSDGKLDLNIKIKEEPNDEDPLPIASNNLQKTGEGKGNSKKKNKKRGKEKLETTKKKTASFELFTKAQKGEIEALLYEVKVFLNNGTGILSLPRFYSFAPLLTFFLFVISTSN